MTVAAVELTVTRACPHLQIGGIGSDEEKARSRENGKGAEFWDRENVAVINW